MSRQKPKCGKGQSCGDACIDIKDTCKELLDPAMAAKLTQVVQHLAILKAKAVDSFPDSDTGKDFDTLAAKYPFVKGTGTEEKLGRGLSIWHLEMSASDGSNDKLTYSVVLTRDRSFTVSDGLIKEFTASDRQGLFKEGLAAAIRAKVETDALAKQSVPATATPAVPMSVQQTVAIPKPAALDSSRAKLVAEFGSKKVAAAEANVKKVFDDPDTQVFIRVASQNSLEKILGGGRMLTSAEMGVTKHTVPDLQDKNYQTARNRVEDLAVGVPLATAPADRPIYGYLGSVKSSQLTGGSHVDVQAYGSIAIKLKSEAKDRASFTGSDSFKGGIASPVSDPNAASLVASTKFGYDVTDQSAPIPSFARSAAQSQKATALDKAARAKDIDELNQLAPTGANYIEAQIHGGVKTSDIEEINFTPRSLKDSPSPDVLAKAAALGIRVKIHGVEYDANKAANAVNDLVKRPGGTDAYTIESALRGHDHMGHFGESVANLDKASKAVASLPGAKQDPQLYALQQARGFTDKPKVVTDAELASELKTGTLLVRGVKASYSAGLSADDVADLTRTGDHYIGYGMYGHGMYVGHAGQFFNSGLKDIYKSRASGHSAESFVPGTASQADIDMAYSGPINGRFIDKTGKSTTDLRMSLPATARVATQTQVRAEMQEAAKAWNDYASDPANGVSVSKKNKVALMAFGDKDGAIDRDSISRFATMAGYDAIALTESYEPTNFMVVLNHSVLSISDTNRNKRKNLY